MIIATIDLWSMGRPARVALHTIKIWNVGGTATVGEYEYQIWSGRQLVREGKIEGFKRRQKNGAQLLKLVIDDAYPVVPLMPRVPKLTAAELEDRVKIF